MNPSCCQVCISVDLLHTIFSFHVFSILADYWLKIMFRLYRIVTVKRQTENRGERRLSHVTKVQGWNWTGNGWDHAALQKALHPVGIQGASVGFFLIQLWQMTELSKLTATSSPVTSALLPCYLKSQHSTKAFFFVHFSAPYRQIMHQSNYSTDNVSQNKNFKPLGKHVEGITAEKK